MRLTHSYVLAADDPRGRMSGKHFLIKCAQFIAEI